MVIYSDAGVHTELKKKVSEIFYKKSKETWDNRKGKIGEVFIPYDNFSGIRTVNVSMLPPGTLMGSGADGVGTKVEIAERVNNHKTIAYDLVSMVCDDEIVRGAEPVFLLSDFSVNYLHEGCLSAINELAEGYVNAAKEANVAILNGEVAELGKRVGGYGNFNYNWNAIVNWFVNKDKMFTGFEIREGDSIIGLKENGFRSNGLSLVRKIMEENYGYYWHFKDKDKNHDSEMKMAKEVLTPSKIYTKAFLDIYGGYKEDSKVKINGVVNITEGGIPEKLSRVLKPSGLGAVIEDSFSPPDIMLHVQKIGNVSDKEAYKTWNMGQGLIIISPEPEKVIYFSEKNNTESKKIGYVVREPKIRINSKGAFSSGTELVFD